MLKKSIFWVMTFFLSNWWYVRWLELVSTQAKTYTFQKLIFWGKGSQSETENFTNEGNSEIYSGALTSLLGND